MKRHDLQPLPPLGSLWLITGLSLVMAPHLLRLPSWLGLLCLLAMGWRVARDLREWPLPRTPLRLALTFGGMGAVFAAFGTIVGQDAGVALLTVMLSLKLVEMATLRDATVVVLLAYFLVAAGFLFDQSLFSGVYLFGAVVVLTATLVVLNHPGARAGLTRDYLRRSAALLIQALPLMAVLFVLFPRVQALGWGVQVTTAGARTGLSETMSIGDVANLANSTEIAFRVEFQDHAAAPGERYWRGPVLWHTDGRKWTTLTPMELQAAGRPRPFTSLSPPLDYTVSLPADTTGRWLPSLDLPALVPDKSIATADLQLFGLRQTAGTERNRRYQMRSFTRYRWTGLAPGLRAKALALPAGRHPRATALGGEWAARLAPADRVRTALRHFREEPFRYTRRPPLLEQDPIDQFLFETRRGFCEHYSAAFVVLMRAAGVPARVVTGYEGGEYNPLGNYWAVSQSDAHAWAEVYLEEEGWVRVDPTAVIPPSRIEADAVAAVAGGGRGGEAGTVSAFLWRVAAQGWDAANFHWNRWVAGYSVERQRELLDRFGLLAWGRAGLIALLVGAAGAALAAALWMGTLPRRERDPAVRLYRRFCARLGRVGLERAPREGERAYAERVARLRPDLAGPAAGITTLYQRLRYGRPGPDALRQLRAALAAFRP